MAVTKDGGQGTPSDQVANRFLRIARNVAWVVLVVIVGAVLFIDLKLLPESEEAHKAGTHLLISPIVWERLAELLVHFIPIVLLFILIDPISDWYQEMRDGHRKEALAAQLDPIKAKLEQLNSTVTSLCASPEVERFEPSFKQLDWRSLLDKSDEVHLSMYYSSSEFNQDCLIHFQRLWKNNGTLYLYLPNPIKITDILFDALNFNPGISNKILRTARVFKEEQAKINRGKLEVHFIDKGFNYMYARIVKANKELFVYSPYQNNKTDNLAPAVVVDLSRARDTMVNFVSDEMSSIKEMISQEPQLGGKYLIWEKEKARVFVSLSQSCPAGCQFCYIDSILPGQQEKAPAQIGELLAKAIVTHPDFVAGVHGTVILIGGFTDPLYAQNAQRTVDLLRGIVGFGNLIHIATRFGIDDNLSLKKILVKNKQIIMNYSLSCLDEKVEPKNNFDKRFEEMGTLKKEGVSVALYLRPVLPFATLRDTPKIIEKLTAHNIKDVTIGGLYIDDEIRQRLMNVGVAVPDKFVSGKEFVLDETKKLKKLQGNEVEKVTTLFAKAGFHTFSTSMEVVDHYRPKT